MIKFFRKIRQNLLSEGKTGKYLKYAIGEIMLLVIGILIALQVNNWNENRITENIKSQAFSNLKEDILYDIHYYKYLDSLYSKWHNQADNIYSKLLTRSMDRINSIDEYIVGRGSMNHLSVKTTTFDEMVNTGLIYKINNPKLSQSINEYYEFAVLEIEKINLDNQEFYRYILRTSGYEYINTGARIWHKVNLEYVDWSWLKDPKSERYMKFESRIDFHRVAIEANKLVIGQLIEKAENVLRVIDSGISSDEKVKK
ncbi:MAG: hypothetical protein KJN70_15115 [Eudoraea sp.]|nr:hypothetical protein [Eudoraea sp.]